MTRFIIVTSGKGGVGKTTTAINLGTALSSFGRDVLVLDGDLNTPNIGLYLGAPAVPISLHDVLKRNGDIKEAAYLHPSGLKVIPGSISLDNLKKVNYKDLKDALSDLVGTSEVVIIDSAPGLGNDALNLMKAADEAIIVTNPELPAVTEALKTIRRAERIGTKISGVVITRHRGDEVDMSPSNIEEILEKPIIGIIPEDDNIRKSVRMKHPITFSHPNSSASIGYKRLAANLLGEKYEESLLRRDGLFSYILRMIGIK